MNQKQYLNRCGVHDPLHQAIIIENLPCGIATVQRAMEDTTSVIINGPRAILVCHWKGMVRAFQKLEARTKGYGA